MLDTRAEIDMNARRFDNFGDLYRAALAENNPDVKQQLLAHVKNALELWAEADRKRTNSALLGSKQPLRVNRTVHRVA